MARGESRFEWDRHNTAHVARHRIKPAEVEQVFANDPEFVETIVDLDSGEERVLELGHTKAGRVLFIVWTLRARRIRVVTAFPANRKTSSSYYKRKKNEEPADDEKTD
jgi:uncharacterized DUF497 family protein